MKDREQRFMDQMSPEPNTGCWLWLGSLSNGYGYFCGKGAHRWAYEHLVGEVPAGLHLDHLCRVRCCVNPAHLEPVTPRVNILRGVGFATINAKKAHCDQGHSLSGDNLYIRESDNGRLCRICMAGSRGKFIQKWGNRYRKPIGAEGSEMSRSVERIKVEVGQVWEDCDQRDSHNGGVRRRVVVQSVDERYAYCLSAFRKVRINLNRMYPYANGYRLISPAGRPADD